ncbi:GAF domain-containing protein [Aestuariibius sp. HNIBRBA575]|uniref:GAF domain-containing protein n=1 Tax=Aestuariibius sp. HNIBRBA575 TaxID=3233343 RepID=UPI0034A4F82F
MISYLDDSLHHICSSAGLDLPLESGNTLTFDYSICRHVQMMNFPLVVEDALTHPLLVDNKSINELGVLAYIGVPIRDAAGRAVGCVSAVQKRSRRWCDADLELLTQAAKEIEKLIPAPAMG